MYIYTCTYNIGLMVSNAYLDIPGMETFENNVNAVKFGGQREIRYEGYSLS